jgi:ABC-type multidrug transport system ATPase subunit/peptidoglycan/LPS O-acetylase OafA/YrhL
MATTNRLHALDAVRGFALLLGVVFHAGLSFTPGMPPGVWAAVDNSPSAAIGVLGFASHIFRMSLFFFVAGFFARMMFHRKGARSFWADRAKRIGIPLVAGWLVMVPTLGLIWVWGLTKTFGGTLPAPPADMPPPPAAAFPLTHLWFLYYLLILYVIVVGGRVLVVALDRHGAIRRATDALVRGLVRTGSAAVVLPVPLIVALLVHPQWHATAGIPTPDRSLIPQIVSLVGYGTAVAFGWLIHRQIDLLGVWARQWPIHLGAALLTTLAGLALIDDASSVSTGFALPRVGYAVSYSLAVWSWSLALIGLAQRFLSREMPVVRYVAEASYWIYLIHLPVVVVGQVLVSDLPWHWSIKFPLMLAVSFVLLFASYHALVRRTFIGRVLNGRTYAPGAAPSAKETATGATATGVDQSDVRLATLRDVHKHYGKTIALAGLDLDVRRGELLAVLGPNGAGKSTAIGLWLGLIQPDAGTVHVFGQSPLDIETRRQVGVMMQDVGLTSELRVRELIALTSSYYPDPLPVDEVLTVTNLRALAGRPYGTLSGGQKRQVQFALAMCGRPPLLFLDEPTVGLDVEARETLWRIVRTLLAQGASIVLTTHYLEEAEALADRVAVLASGRLVAYGTVGEIRSVVARRHISCASVLDAAAVAQWEGVVTVTREGPRLHITVVDAEDVVRRLLATDDGVRDLEVRPAGLAEAFTALTKEAA